MKFSGKTEFDFIETIRRRYKLSRIGDDCAVLPKDSVTDTVVTTDLLVEDIDFKLEWTTPEFVGHKALAVSLSDVAAMGAKPVWAMLSIGVPARVWKTDFVEKFYDGWFALAKKSGVELVGGDVSKTPDKIVVDSIVAGEVKRGKAVLRSGANVGDLIFVTGELGGAAAGLRLLEAGERYEKSANVNLLRRQLAPNPQTEIGQVLAAKNLASAMIDLSDGLSSDLRHLCRSSGVGARLFADEIPIDKRLKKFQISNLKSQITHRKRTTETRIEENLSFALDGGEDFELLFTVNRKKIFALEKQLANFPFSRIGEITSDADKIELITEFETAILQPKGFRHF